tara:strand:+ start:161 stop:517 length:357 start_codon:yes stop_codon:yes gene_type:complete
MIGGVQPKILLTQDENGNLKMNDEMGNMLFSKPEMRWKLVRERDGLTKQSKDIKWLEFNEDGTFKEQFKEVAIGRSLMMSPFNRSFTWQTTEVTEIVEQREDYIKFKTKNSNYELFKL